MAISLSSIRKSQFKPPIIVIHGTCGIGKSTFASCAPNPVFLPIEEGLGGLSVDAFPLISSWADLMEAMGSLYTEDHQYQTMVIDSLSALELIINSQVAKDNNKSNIEDIPYGRGYAFAVDYWKQLIEGISALRDKKNITPILIAHTEITRFDSPEIDSYDRYVISLHKRAVTILNERADIIGFANWRTHVVKTDAGFNQKQSRGVGTGERLLHLVERPAYIAKNRYGMPETIPLDWSAFIAAMSIAQTKTQ